KVLAEYSWSPTTTQSGSFLCTAACSTPIRIITREVRYIHELSITLEHSMPISSPAAPGLTQGTCRGQTLEPQCKLCSRTSKSLSLGGVDGHYFMFLLSTSRD